MSGRPVGLLNIFALLCWTIFFSQDLFSKEVGGGASQLRLDFALYDFPYNSQFGRHPLLDPSMTQSLSFATSMIQTQNYLMGRIFENEEGSIEWYGKPIIFLGDIILAFMPGNDVWLHEEWHRAVMGHHDIYSYNGVLSVGQGGGLGSVPVNQVKDENLIRLKKEHPEDMVRLSAAGIEGEQALIRDLTRDGFFHKKHPWNYGSMWVATIASLQYYKSCTSSKAPSRPDEGMNSELEEERDFTGLDCSAWVYDLFRPDEPYESRGNLDSGGIARSRFFGDLSGREKDFLNETKAMSYISLINPALFGFDGFNWGGIDYQFFTQHYMTSFGYLVDLNVLLDVDGDHYAFSYHYFRSPTRAFPGLTIERNGFQPLRETPISLDFRLSLWEQPYKLRFDRRTGRTGALGAVKIRYHWDASWQPYLLISSKTEGWAVGYVDQQSSWQGVGGLLVNF